MYTLLNRPTLSSVALSLRFKTDTTAQGFVAPGDTIFLVAVPPDSGYYHCITV